MGCLLLKHFSNFTDETHVNNYWGNKQAAESKKEVRKSFRPAEILRERKNLPLWMSWQREELLNEASKAANEAQLRRKRRFDAHFNVLKEFVEEHLQMPGVIDEVFQVSFLLCDVSCSC